MLQMILPEGSSSLLAFFGILFAFGATVLATAKLSPYLPKDAGREFAHDGKLSAGKPRGAGIIFVMAFVASVLLFSPLSAELVIYLLLIVVCMMTGFLDDASKTPWGEYKKGFLDLCVAALVAITFLKYNSNVVELALFHPAACGIRHSHGDPGMDLRERDQLLRWCGRTLRNPLDHYDHVHLYRGPYEGRQ